MRTNGAGVYYDQASESDAVERVVPEAIPAMNNLDIVANMPGMGGSQLQRPTVGNPTVGNQFWNQLAEGNHQNSVGDDFSWQSAERDKTPNFTKSLDPHASTWIFNPPRKRPGRASLMCERCRKQNRGKKVLDKFCGLINCVRYSV